MCLELKDQLHTETFCLRSSSGMQTFFAYSLEAGRQKLFLDCHVSVSRIMSMFYQCEAFLCETMSFSDQVKKDKVSIRCFHGVISQRK